MATTRKTTSRKATAKRKTTRRKSTSKGCGNGSFIIKTRAEKKTKRKKK